MASGWKIVLDVFYPVIKTGRAVYAGSATLQAIGKTLRHSTAAMAGSALLGAIGRAMRRSASAFSGSSAVSPVGRKVGRALVLFGAVSALVAVGRHFRRATVGFSGEGALAAAGERTFLSYRFVGLVGQSLANGSAGVPVLSTSQPYYNRMLDTGVNAGPIGGYSSLVPLVSGVAPDELYPNVSMGETVGPAVTAELSRLAGWNTVLASNATGGTQYNALKKGSGYYARMIDYLETTIDLLAAASLPFVNVPCMIAIHGEADQAFQVEGYAAKLAEWQSDLEDDIQAETSQAEEVPLFITQQGTPSSAANSVSVATAPLQFAAFLANPTKVVLVGPNYQYMRADGLHLTAHGYRAMGCKIAQAVHQHLNVGTPWKPLHPVSFVRTGAQLDVTFHVPVPPLVLDFVAVLNPAGAGRPAGFEWVDSSDSIDVSTVQILSADTVRITLSDNPDGNTGMYLRYAYTNSGVSNGPILGARGNLRDSDTFPNPYGYRSYNWCVVFDLPIE